MNESLVFHLLNLIPGCGGKTLREAVARFGSAQAAWEASERDWQAAKWESRFNPAGLDAKRAAIDPGAEEAKLAQSKIEVIPFTDPGFPTLLHEIPQPPALLYMRGSWRGWNDMPLVAIVGSRDYSPYGKQVAEELSRELSRSGVAIVSGLAFGIDSIAHEGALAAEAPTIAVLGGGVDDASIAPQSHLRLAQSVMSHGAIVSEYAPGTPPATGTFPARNRIIAGMTMGTVVVEAKEGSGSLITARLAVDANRDVFAVPGSIFSPLSAGTNALIKEGAKLVTSVQDILAELDLTPSESTDAETHPVELTEDESAILRQLSRDGLHIDKVIEASRLETTRAAALITRLEMRGLIKNIGNMQYIKLKG